MYLKFLGLKKKSLSIYENVPNILGGGEFLVQNFVYQAPVNRSTQNPDLAEISAYTCLLQNFSLCVDYVDHVIIPIQIHVCLFFIGLLWHVLEHFMKKWAECWVVLFQKQ